MIKSLKLCRTQVALTKKIQERLPSVDREVYPPYRGKVQLIL